MKYDLLIVGGGPAGLTAAIHARVRDKSALVITNEPTASPLCRAPAMANYPGLPGVTGLELVQRLVAQAEELGAQFKQGRALSVMPMGSSVMVSVENDAVEGRAVILAPGVSRAAPSRERRSCWAGGELLRHLRRDVLPGQAGGVRRGRPQF